MKSKKVMAMMLVISGAMLLGACNTAADGSAANKSVEESSVAESSVAESKETAKQQAAFLVTVETNRDFSATLGETEPVMVTVEPLEGGERQMVSISCGAAMEELGNYDRVSSVCAARSAEGKHYVFVTCDHMSNDFSLFVYDVTDGQLIRSDKISGKLDCVWSTMEQLLISERVDVLGTYFAKSVYSLDSNGKLVKMSHKSDIESEWEMSVIKELPVKMNGVECTLAVDTVIVVNGTNNVDEVYFVVPATGEEGIISYTLDEEKPWIHNINGISEYEYFDNVPYGD